MYAVIKAGGKQHKVQSGDVIEVELQHGDAGDKVELKPILVVDDDGKLHYGKEAGRAVVVAKLVGEQKGDKIKVFKYRPKSGYARKQGHRQLMTLLEIEDVKLGGRRAPAKKDGQVETAEAKEQEPAPAAAAKAKPAAKATRAKASTATKSRSGAKSTTAKPAKDDKSGRAG